MKRLSYGKGYNSGGKYKTRIDGRIVKSYQTWQGMLLRCYSPSFHIKQPTYIDCSVDDKWLDYQVFAEWYEKNEHSNKGYHLDKDILIKGNKIYSPETCVFVPRQINALLTDSGDIKINLPQGVYLNKRDGNYVARMSVNDKSKHLGYFDNVEEAYQAYKTAKERHVKNVALKWANKIQWEVFVALMQWRLV